jgi:hypothetical protein
MKTVVNGALINRKKAPAQMDRGLIDKMLIAD